MASASKQIQLLFGRDGPWCHFCGYEIRIRNPMNNEQASPTRDHIVPKALGGKTTLENLRLAHKFCNSVRALGFERGHKNHPKYLKFLDRLAAHGYFFNPNFTGPASHGLSECPKHLLPKEKVWSKTAFFTIGPLAFDIRFTPGRYSHLRVSLGSKHLTGMGYIKE